MDNRIRKLCLRVGIDPVKSAHDIRRTVATRLYRNTHDIELVRKFLGHSDVMTTWGYIVDIDAEEEDRMRVVDALKDASYAVNRTNSSLSLLILSPARSIANCLSSEIFSAVKFC